MAGPVPSVAQVPVREVLPRNFAEAVDGLRRLGTILDGRRPSIDHGGWHWYPESVRKPQASTERIHHLLLDIAIPLYNTGVDWLELTVNIAWATPPNLMVNAAVEVACRCAQNHNMHAVRDVSWSVTDSEALVEAFATATAMVGEVLSTGPHEPGAWRIKAGLPDASP